jgi:hypothetical protein
LFLVLGTAALLIGSGAFFVYFGVPLWKTLAARRWNPTTAIVIDSKVRSNWVHGHKVQFRVYSPDVVYAYEVDGRAFRSNTYNLTDLPTPWYYGKRGVVRRFPPGSRVNCFVNPRDPFDAVLSRRLSVSLWFGVWPLIIAALGFWGVVGGLTSLDFKIRGGRLGGIVGLGLATAFSLHATFDTGSDLLRDLNAGTDEWQEIVGVAVLGIVTLVLFVLLVRLIFRTASLRSSGRVWFIC